jgi:hypothetical protein
MSGTGGRDYYIITLKGERGPVDRAEMRELLAGNEIRTNDLVRSAFGRNLGNVAQLLATPSDRQGAGVRRQPPPVRDRTDAKRPAAVPAAIFATVLLAVVALVLWLGASTSKPSTERAPSPIPTALPTPQSAPASASPAPVATGSTQPAGPLGSSQITASASGRRLAQLAADGDLSTCWRVPIDAPDAAGRLAWIQYRTGARRAAAYALVAAGMQPEADPGAWRLVGILADGREEIIDTRHDETFSGRCQRRIFPIGRPGTYAAYRLDLLAVHRSPPAEALQLGEFQLLESAPSSSLALPPGWSTTSIGGEVSPAPEFDGVMWTVRGAGREIFNTQDDFRFVHTSMPEEATLTAFLLASDGRFDYAKTGIMIRASGAPDAPYVLLSLTPLGRTDLNYRPAAGAEAQFSSSFTSSPPVWLRLTRRGTQVTGALSINQTHWISAGTVSFPAMTGTMLAGLALCSMQPEQPMTARFTQVKITTP